MEECLCEYTAALDAAKDNLSEAENELSAATLVHETLAPSQSGSSIHHSGHATNEQD
jgi:hypothetical protein